MVMPAPQATPAYPARFEVDYPDRQLDRLTSFFRIFTVIPIAIILGFLTNATFEWGSHTTVSGWQTTLSTGGFLFVPLVLMLLFRQKYPRWWFDWNLALTRFSYRVASYIFLLRDEYPSTDEEQAVHVEMDYPDAPKELGRGWPLIKWLLAIPHYIVLAFLGIAVFVVWIIAWFAILFTGRYPRSFFDFIVGFMRWGLRVEAYAFLLITDRYPPFSFSA